jgi:hypothetical protein
MNNNNYFYLTDMFEIYVECNKNRNQSVRRYSDRFPNREVPDPRKFVRLEFRRNGSFKKRKREQRRFGENVEMDVLLSVEENPRVSTWEIASNMGISNQTVQPVLRKHTFKSYIPQKVNC